MIRDKRGSCASFRIATVPTLLATGFCSGVFLVSRLKAANSTAPPCWGLKMESFPRQFFLRNLAAVTRDCLPSSP